MAIGPLYAEKASLKAVHWLPASQWAFLLQVLGRSDVRRMERSGVETSSHSSSSLVMVVKKASLLVVGVLVQMCSAALKTVWFFSVKAGTQS